MRLRTFNYEITITMRKDGVELKTNIVLKACSVNREQALKIAQILWPDYEILDVKFKI